MVILYSVAIHILQLIIVTINPTGYLSLNLRSQRHCAHCVFTVCYMAGYSINFGFGLLLSSQNLLLLVAVSFLVVTPLYLVGEWLSNKRNVTQCLGSPESSHNDEIHVT